MHKLPANEEQRKTCIKLKFYCNDFVRNMFSILPEICLGTQYYIDRLVHLDELKPNGQLLIERVCSSNGLFSNVLISVDPSVTVCDPKLS